MKKIIALLSIFFLAACGGKNEAILLEKQRAKSGKIVEIIAENWAFDKETYVVPAGEITVNLKNKEGFHGIAIEGTDIAIEGDGFYTTTLEAGEYKIVCSIICGTGHYDMVATLVVKE